MKAKLGILAGRGDMPKAIVEACQAEGRPFFLLGFEGQSEDWIVQHSHAVVPIGAANDIISTLKQNQVQELVMAGGIRRPSLAALKPDWKAAKILAKIGFGFLGDDGLLRAVIKELEQEGFRLIGADSILTGNIAPQGQIGKHAPKPQQIADIERGVKILEALSPVDVGQAVVVQQGVVLGIEAAEGTDRLIQRCAELIQPGDAPVLVKMRKRGQESRADMPAIGPDTVDNAARSGIGGIAIEAGGTMMIRPKAMTEKADFHGIFLYGFLSSDKE